MRLTPKEACKKFCIQCLGLKRFDAKAIEDCQGDICACGPCPLYPHRMGKRISLKVLRAHCLYCMGGSRMLVSECATSDCELYPYRMGRNPVMVGIRKGVNRAVDGSFKAKVERSPRKGIGG